MIWHQIDIRWAYANLLPAIQRQTGCHHRSADILQESLLRFALSLSPNRLEKPHAYLRTIAQHLVSHEYQYEKRLTPLDLALSSQAFDEALVPSAEFMAETNQRLAHTQQIIQQLPPRCREAFWLYQIEGYTQAEVAQQLGISKNMVERHIMRAIVDLSSARELIMAE